MTPNWYPDPADPKQLRWWDGSSWTSNVSLPSRSTRQADTSRNIILGVAILIPLLLAYYYIAFFI